MGLHLLIVVWRNSPQWAMASSFTRFLEHTQRHATAGRTPLGEWSARRRDLYLTTNNNHNRQIPMPPVGFEPTISVGERPQTYTLDSVATGTGTLDDYYAKLPAHEDLFGCFANINCTLYKMIQINRLCKTFGFRDKHSCCVLWHDALWFGRYEQTFRSNLQPL